MQLVHLMIHSARADELAQHAARLELSEDDLALNVMLRGLAAGVALDAGPIPQPVSSREYRVPAVVAEALSAVVVEQDSTLPRAFHDFSTRVLPELKAEDVLHWSRCEGICEEDEETHLVVQDPDDRVLLQCRFDCQSRRFPVRYRGLPPGLSDLAARALITETIFVELHLDAYRPDCDGLDFTNEDTGRQHSCPYPPPPAREQADGARDAPPPEGPGGSDVAQRLGDIGLAACVGCGQVAKPSDLVVSEQGAVCDACHDLREQAARPRPWWKFWG